MEGMKNAGDIKLTIKQARKVYVFEKLYGGKMSNAEAASTLGLSVRQVQRIKKTFETKGHLAFQHGNTGRKPARALSEDVRKRVIERASLYEGTSCQHIAELLAEEDNVCISAKSVIRILSEKGIKFTCSHRGPRKRQRRERRRKRGELVQIDASPFDWLSNGTMCSLHGAIDDATGEIVGLWLAGTEQLNGYFHVMERMIRTSGVPRALYMDGHTIFFSPQGKKLTTEEELEGRTVALTQFGKALELLGIHPIRASSPQAKGRVERLWGTLQKRLPVDMQTAKIHDMEGANKFLHEYMKKHNRRFAVEAAEEETSFLPGPSEKLLRFILCGREERKTTGDSSISWKGKTYTAEEKRGGAQKLFRRGTTVSVLTQMDGSLAIQYGEEIFPMKEIPERREAKGVKRAGGAEGIKSQDAYKPALNHPWRNGFGNCPGTKREHSANSCMNRLE
jgi:transposase